MSNSPVPAAPITHPQLVAALTKPGSEILKSLTPDDCHRWHMSSCILGEIAELVEGFAIGDRINLIEEFGDLEFYLEGLRTSFGIPRTVSLLSPTSSLVGTTQHRIQWAHDHAIVEAGKLFDAIKRGVLYRKETNLEEVMRALGALESHLEVMRTSHAIARAETLAANITKLSKRYQKLSYSDQAAQQRADKAPGT